MFLILAAAAAASLCTGAITYFVAKPSGSSSSGNTNMSAGIENNINLSLEGKHDVTNTLLVFLICLRLFEFLLYAFNTYRKTLKKRYSKQPATTPAAPAQP